MYLNNSYIILVYKIIIKNVHILLNSQKVYTGVFGSREHEMCNVLSGGSENKGFREGERVCANDKVNGAH